ncbi:MAG: cysteine hydrolase [Kaiparowitsia implicata GSE-PSE-MK54-09C]|nr:cysteine hydrolase [Kaiparowitsia implicata GSE-PSE-MK54-09C]
MLLAKGDVMTNSLPPLTSRAAHICIDMQRIFSAQGPWSTPWLPKVLPQCVALAQHRPEATIFTRFVTSVSPDTARGAWKSFYREWPETTSAILDPALLDLVPELARFAPPAPVFDKPVYSAFAGRKLVAHLLEREIDTVILSGAETDVCVLSSALGAVDHGFHVVVATDAVCSFSDKGHDALLDLFKQRFSQQISAAETAQILEEWRA